MLTVQMILLAALVILSLLLVGMLAWSIYSIWLLWYGAPFVRSKQHDIVTMLELAQLKSSDNSVDIGCGDGEVVAAVAEKGIKVEGFDINPVLVWKAQEKIKKHGLESLAKVFKADVWSTDVSKYSVVFLYGITYIMPKLEQKLLSELKPGSRVISNYFQFPHWPVHTKKDKIHLYIVPEQKTH